MGQPKYIIIAGINGAGKSTLYQTHKSIFEQTKRINADEILKKNGGDWRNQNDNFKAMREEVKQIHEAFDKRISIHVETTLSGTGKAQLNLIEEAKSKGYEVTLHYVTLDSAEKAIERVNQRVNVGGHGIAPEVIRKRYDQSFKNLPKISYKSDNVFIYDNSKVFKNVYGREKGVVRYNYLSKYPFINISLNYTEKVQKELNNYSEKNKLLQQQKVNNNKKDNPKI